MIKAFETSLPGFYLMEDDLSGDEDNATSNVEQLDDLKPDTILNFNPKGLTCAAHTLQLVIKDGLKVSKDIFEIISKISTLINSIRKSCSAMEELEKKQIVLKTSNATRWNSQLTMIKSIIDGINKFEASIQQAIKLLPADKNLNAIDLNLVEELIKVSKENGYL